MDAPLLVILVRGPGLERSCFVTHPFFSSGLVDWKKNVTAVGATALVEATERVPASTVREWLRMTMV
jgi:hypothetical protein